MPLTVIVLKAFSSAQDMGGHARWYMFLAPLDEKGTIDFDRWLHHVTGCTAVCWDPQSRQELEGRLRYVRQTWCICVPSHGGEWRCELGDQTYALGSLINARDPDGLVRTYEVAQLVPTGHPRSLSKP